LFVWPWLLYAGKMVIVGMAVAILKRKIAFVVQTRAFASIAKFSP
jgi:hypothetical protein